MLYRLKYEKTVEEAIESRADARPLSSSLGHFVSLPSLPQLARHQLSGDLDDSVTKIPY